MKKIITVFLALTLIICFAGCQKKEDTGIILLNLPDIKNVESIAVSSLPPAMDYVYTDDDSEIIFDYLSKLTLVSDFPENPDDYVGTTWEIVFNLKDDAKLTLYYMCNMFIRTEDSSWYKVQFSESYDFSSLIERLNNN